MRLETLTNQSPRVTDGGKFTKKFTIMYLGKREILNKEEYEALRNADLCDKRGATNVAFSELEGLINNAALARQYFKRSPAWLTQRINGNTVFNKKAGFRPDEYRQLADAFRDIARRLEAHADEIDAAAADPA